MDDNGVVSDLQAELARIRGVSRSAAAGQLLPQVAPEEVGRALSPCYAVDGSGRVVALSLSHLGLDSIPDAVFSLESLQLLRLFGNEICRVDARLQELPSLRVLHLADNRLSEVPAEVLGLRSLEVLGLNGNRLRFLPETFAGLTRLTTLGLSQNPLGHVPRALEALARLERLFLDYTDLLDLPVWVLELPSLTQLGLSGLCAEDLPGFSRARGLRSLRLARASVSELPGEFWELPALRELDLGHSRLSHLPTAVQALEQLERLDVSGTRISAVPSALGRLGRLRELQIASVALGEPLPESLGDLSQLEVVNLSSVRLRSVPSFLQRLARMEQLDLGSTGLTAVPRELFALPRLRSLNLAGNRIRWLPPSVADSDWTFVWAGGGSASESAGAGRQCIVYENPLESPPPEIVVKGPDALRSYLRSASGGTLPINEVKVLVVGDGGSGKTSLAKQLLGRPFDEAEPQTHGINIDDWEFVDPSTERRIPREAASDGPQMRARVWDFGGQEIMHATHQFFLSKRSAYVLVVDSRREEKAEYWLQHIQTFGGGSPAFVVINKVDENPGFDLNRRFLQEKYPEIAAFFRISCRTGDGVERFAHRLRKHLSRLRHARTEWAPSWLAVKEGLERAERDYLPFSEYCDICSREGVVRSDDQETLVELLHDLGVVLRFRDLPLRDTNVINPRWVTEGVYNIINSRRLADSEGLLDAGELAKALNLTSHPPETHNFILELMKKFELCYSVSRTEVLVPSLLPVEEPSFDRGGEGDEVRFHLVYDFLPKSVIARFIVRMHADIHESLRWRTGVVLQAPAGTAKAFVRADDERRRVEIRVRGSHRRDYLSVIVHSFRTINSSYGRLRAEERVPLPDNPAVSAGLEHLMYLESRGVRSFIPEKSTREYEVGDLLGRVRGAKAAEDEILEILRSLREAKDTEDSMLEKANEVVKLKPSVFGIGVDLNALIRRVLSSRSS